MIILTIGNVIVLASTLKARHLSSLVDANRFRCLLERTIAFLSSPSDLSTNRTNYAILERLKQSIFGASQKGVPLTVVRDSGWRGDATLSIVLNTTSTIVCRERLAQVMQGGLGHDCIDVLTNGSAWVS